MAKKAKARKAKAKRKPRTRSIAAIGGEYRIGGEPIVSETRRREALDPLGRVTAQARRSKQQEADGRKKPIIWKRLAGRSRAGGSPIPVFDDARFDESAFPIEGIASAGSSVNIPPETSVPPTLNAALQSTKGPIEPVIPIAIESTGTASGVSSASAAGAAIAAASGATARNAIFENRSTVYPPTVTIGPAPRKARRGRTRIGKSIAAHSVEIGTSAVAFLILIDTEIKRLKDFRPNSAEAVSERDAKVADLEDLKRRAEVFLQSVQGFQAKTLPEAKVVADTNEFAAGVKDWYKKRHVQAFDVGLVAAGTTVCSLAGADPSLALGVVASLVGGKHISEVAKAYFKGNKSAKDKDD